MTVNLNFKYCSTHPDLSMEFYLVKFDIDGDSFVKWMNKKSIPNAQLLMMFHQWKTSKRSHDVNTTQVGTSEINDNDDWGHPLIQK